MKIACSLAAALAIAALAAPAGFAGTPGGNAAKPVLWSGTASPARPYLAAGAAQATEHRAGYRNWSQDQMRSLQQALIAKGYKVQASGTWDDPTRAALREFQHKQGLTPTGYPNRATRKALGLDW